MLFNEPKLLKFDFDALINARNDSFSALQRAEIAEIVRDHQRQQAPESFSALQRAEIAEICGGSGGFEYRTGFQCSSTSRNC